ncbi:hypothetical protein [Sphingomonas sp. LaA6.9]|uniref:hypothetical protein n=1 Tax=Sphingomonas sp. LaA6.9 TaxID=2919914 RepID=UPI001F4F9530|nr:hypothetical protein [Sphingomonas sp. LaA6.9]MCJ8158832.1 hypothetical protein [Sphingomonas sp. LaA6.9]
MTVLTHSRFIGSAAVRMRQEQCGIDYIGRRLGRDRSTPETVVRLVRELIRDHGFPPPLGYRRWRGKLVQGADAVTPRSVWRRDAVDCFFEDDGTPPALIAKIDQADLAAQHDALAANAASLVA